MTGASERGLFSDESGHDPNELDLNKVVYKIGTNAIWRNGEVVKENLDHAANQLAEVFDLGGRVIVIASGVTGRGRISIERAIREGRIEPVEKFVDDPHRASQQAERIRQEQAISGQTDLMADYYNALKAHGVSAECMFVGSEHINDWPGRLDFNTRVRVVLLNGNNATLKPGDKLLNNDNVAELVTTKFTNSGSLGIVTPPGGVLDDKDQIITWIDARRRFRNRSVRSVAKSVDGTGGMDDKVDIARRIARRGVRVAIMGIGAAGTSERPLVEFYNGVPVETYISTHRPKELFR